MRPSALPILLLAAALVAAAGCASDGSPSGGSEPSLGAAAVDAAAQIPTPEGMDPQLLQPLVGLGPCTAEITPLPDEVPELVVLPPGAQLTEIDETGPVTNLQGYVPLTPVQTRVFYQQLEDAEILQVEDEIREAEVLLSREQHRFFFKSQAVCEQGSVFVGVLAPEAAGGQIPTPQRGGGITTEAPG